MKTVQHTRRWRLKAPVNREVKCKRCGSKVVTEYQSLNEKYCHDCNDFYEWHLTEGQESTTIEGQTYAALQADKKDALLK